VADKLYHDGDFEKAIAIYTEAALQGDDSQRREALWTLARIRYERGDMREAEQALEAFLALGPGPKEETRANLFLGLVRFIRGENAKAQESLRRYVDRGGSAASYARLRLAELSSRRGDPAEAIREVETALTQGLPPPLETDARFALARYQEASGDTASAVATYGQLALDAATAFDRAEALWQMAILSRRVGDSQSYQQALYSLASQYPWHQRALEALDQPQLASSPALSTAERAVVLFRYRLNDQAAAAFRISLEEQPDPEGQALAHYYLGILAERAGDPVSALAEYGAARVALQGNPTHALFARASWEEAFLLESLGRLGEAAQAYAALADASPLAEETPQALFRAGLTRFRQGRMADASLFWERYLNSAASPTAQAQAHFWLARAAQTIGDQASAAQHLGSAAAVAPWSYYGLRARALGMGEDPSQDPQTEILPLTADWTRIEDWLRSWAGPEDVQAREALSQGGTWGLAQELAAAGLQDEAEKVLVELLDQATGEPWLLYYLTRTLAEEGQVSLGARVAARLIQGHADAPRDLLALAYPLEYLDLAAQAVTPYGFSPLVLLALVRQESFFDPDAVSSASAMGLTQVIPSTAQEIAGQLEEANFRNSDLFRPRVSLRFGAYYLGAQLRLFDGDLSAALAAYNGGPGNAQRWLEVAPDDPDLFLEIIDFSETRDYVRLVLENYALYRYICGLTEQPSLPLP